MTWITLGKRPVTTHPAILVMLRHTLAAAPDDPRRRRALARELFGLGEYDEAAQVFEQLLDQGGDPGEDWPSMVVATLDVRGSDAALALCDRWAGAGDAAWHHVRACALRAGGGIEAADAEFRRAIALGDPGQASMRAFLRMHAEHGDGTRLLEACDALPRAHAATGSARGYRALALSLLGRDDEANALVDLDTGVMRFRFAPPGGIGLDAFNDALADAILADQPAEGEPHDILLNHAIDLPGSAEYAALRAFIADSYAAYVARHGDRGAAFMPPIAGATRIDHGAVTIRRQGRNGQHVHPAALLTGVYHVRLPALAGADVAPDAGALVVGVCDEIAPGHRASWGSRTLAAEPGTLTLFPAHYFHDVRPTGVEAKRVVVVADLMPA